MIATRKLWKEESTLCLFWCGVLIQLENSPKKSVYASTILLLLFFKTLFCWSNCCSCFISKLPKFRLFGPERIILTKQEGKDGAHDVMCTIMTAMTDAQIEFLTFGSPATDPLTRAQLSTMKKMSSSILSGQHNLIIIVIVMLRFQMGKWWTAVLLDANVSDNQRWEF